MSTPSTPEHPLLTLLMDLFPRGQKLLDRSSIPLGEYMMWVEQIRHLLFRLYGVGAPQVEALFPKPNLGKLKADRDSGEDMHEVVRRSMGRLGGIVRTIEGLAKPRGGRRVFIGHGRSPLWRELKDFLQDRLHLPWDEFNREAVAGYTTFERLEEMLAEAGFAFLVMTAEEEHEDAKVHARQNVVHEVGLFQGRLGPRRAIILLEEGCAEFSNIVGLSQIRFPKGHISACSEEIRRVLEREGLIKAPQ